MTAHTTLMRAIVCALLLSTEATPAHADTATEARFFDELARKQYAAGRYELALDAFLLAHDLTPTASSLYNVAVCAELAKLPALAFAFLEQYTRAPDDDQARRIEAQQRLDALEAKLALVEVVTQPQGARIVIDRDALGSYGSAPRTVVVDPGQHVVIATLDGFRTTRAAVTAVAGASEKVELTLEPLLGMLDVTRSPPDATLHVERDGTPVELAVGSGAQAVPIGRYALRLEAPDYLPAEASVVVTEDVPARVTLLAQPLPPATGQLLVDTGKDAARLFVDGKAVAMTPATLRDLSVGPHALRVVAEHKAPWSATVQVEHDAPTYVNVTLLDAAAANQKRSP